MKLLSETTQRFSVSNSNDMESDNKEEIGLEANESKQTTNVVEFREVHLRPKPGNTNLKTQSDLTTW